MREGFLMGGGLVAAGLMLELSVGPVVWEAFRWPANVVVLAVFCALVLAVFLAGKKMRVCRFIASVHAAIPAMVFAVAFTMVMGLVRQKVNGSWLEGMLSFWPFVLVYAYMALILGVVVLRRLAHLGNWRRDLPFLLNHLGLFVALVTATLGNADMQRMRMVTALGEPEWRAIDQNQKLCELPLAIELKRFVMETYDDGSPKRFASDVQVLTKSGKNISATIDVNKPLEVEGWKIYQYGYDTAAGKDSEISIFELVSDPWLPVVYAGIGMMLAGAVCMFVTGGRRAGR